MSFDIVRVLRARGKDDKVSQMAAGEIEQLRESLQAARVLLAAHESRAVPIPPPAPKPNPDGFIITE